MRCVGQDLVLIVVRERGPTVEVEGGGGGEVERRRPSLSRTAMAISTMREGKNTHGGREP